VDSHNLKSDEYLTIKQPTEGLFKAKGSKFIAYAYPVFQQTDIKNALNEIKSKHPKARHHCYAWKLGLDNNLYRANDDGEPSGSAGKPIFGQIRSNNLSNVLVIVVRYFGGTLLGVSGLIEAYKKATADALEKASIIKKEVHQHFTIAFTYAQMNVVMTALKKLNITVLNKSFTENCIIQISLRQSRVQTVLIHFEKMEGVKVESLI